MNKKLLVLYLGLSTLLFSCADKATKYYNRGLKEFNQDEFEYAIQHFETALEYGAPKGESSYYIAEGYRQSNRLHDALPYYQTAVRSGVRHENAYFYYAYAMKANGNYEGAKSQLKKYLNEVAVTEEHINRAKHELKNLIDLSHWATKPTTVKAENFEEINTEAIEYSPMFHGKDLYFTSSRGEGKTFEGQGTRYTDIFEYKFDGITNLSGQAKPLDHNINKTGIHEATPTFTPDGKTMIFSRSNSGKYNDPTQVVDLYQSRYTPAGWSEPERLTINERDYWDSAPCLTPDGKKLYFSSSRPGGFGELDIWVAYLQPDGTWGNVENAGPTINSDGEDAFPYIAPDGTFYFSSDGHPGYGELDIFKVQKNEDGSEEVVNLRHPINSPHDDFAITFKNGTIGYFTSNREGGKGNDDIYAFEIKIDYILKGIVKGHVLDDMLHITDEEIILPGSTVELMDTLGNVIATTIADTAGRFEFTVEPEKVYHVHAAKPGYTPKKQLFSTVGKTLKEEDAQHRFEHVVFNTKIVLNPQLPTKDPIIVKFPPIFYDYNKWDIRPDAAEVLDLMVKTMKDNPSILVELGSHTDPRNTFKYNDVLSTKRAKSAVKYIVSKGIDPKRIHPVGYGERQPYVLENDTLGLDSGTVLTHEFINTFEKTDKPKFDALHQMNRRTEFKIVGSIAPEEAGIENIEVMKHNETETFIEEQAVKHEKMLIERMNANDEEGVKSNEKAPEEE